MAAPTSNGFAALLGVLTINQMLVIEVVVPHSRAAPSKSSRLNWQPFITMQPGHWSTSMRSGKGSGSDSGLVDASHSGNSCLIKGPACFGVVGKQLLDPSD